MASDSSPGSLTHIELFAGLTPSEIVAVEAQATWRWFRANEQIVDQYHKGREVFFVVSGAVRMLSTAVNKRETFLGTVGAGDFFGELAAIDGKERSARVTAVKDCLVAVLPRGRIFLRCWTLMPRLRCVS